MFVNWGFLISEFLLILILAALVGLIAGWIIWGRHKVAAGADQETRLMAELSACRKAGEAQAARISQLEHERAATTSGATVEPASDNAVPLSETGTRPAALDAARGGKPDDLKLIKGVGPKLEKLVNELGFYHFDQIAAWTAAEVAWVDENLTGFKGRVSRDGWVAQAKTLASGGTTEFSERQKPGES